MRCTGGAGDGDAEREDGVGEDEREDERELERETAWCGPRRHVWWSTSSSMCVRSASVTPTSGEVARHSRYVMSYTRAAGVSSAAADGTGVTLTGTAVSGDATRGDGERGAGGDLEPPRRPLRLPADLGVGGVLGVLGISAGPAAARSRHPEGAADTTIGAGTLLRTGDLPGAGGPRGWRVTVLVVATGSGRGKGV